MSHGQHNRVHKNQWNVGIWLAYHKSIFNWFYLIDSFHFWQNEWRHFFQPAILLFPTECCIRWLPFMVHGVKNKCVSAISYKKKLCIKCFWVLFRWFRPHFHNSSEREREREKKRNTNLRTLCVCTISECSFLLKLRKVQKDMYTNPLRMKLLLRWPSGWFFTNESTANAHTHSARSKRWSAKFNGHALDIK